MAMNELPASNKEKNRLWASFNRKFPDKPRNAARRVSLGDLDILRDIQREKKSAPFLPPAKTKIARVTSPASPAKGSQGKRGPQGSENDSGLGGRSPMCLPLLSRGRTSPRSILRSSIFCSPLQKKHPFAALDDDTLSARHSTGAKKSEFLDQLGHTCLSHNSPGELEQQEDRVPIGKVVEIPHKNMASKNKKSRKDEESQRKDALATPDLDFTPTFLDNIHEFDIRATSSAGSQQSNHSTHEAFLAVDCSSTDVTRSQVQSAISATGTGTSEGDKVPFEEKEKPSLAQNTYRDIFRDIPKTDAHDHSKEADSNEVSNQSIEGKEAIAVDEKKEQYSPSHTRRVRFPTQVLFRPEDIDFYRDWLKPETYSEMGSDNFEKHLANLTTDKRENGQDYSHVDTISFDEHLANLTLNAKEEDNVEITNAVGEARVSERIAQDQKPSISSESKLVLVEEQTLNEEKELLIQRNESACRKAKCYVFYNRFLNGDGEEKSGEEVHPNVKEMVIRLEAAHANEFGYKDFLPIQEQKRKDANLKLRLVRGYSEDAFTDGDEVLNFMKGHSFSFENESTAVVPQVD